MLERLGADDGHRWHLMTASLPLGHDADGRYLRRVRTEPHSGTHPGEAKSRTDPRAQRRPKADIADNVLSGRKTGADMARLYQVSQATISRTVAEARIKQEMNPT